jgi:predicted esterase
LFSAPQPSLAAGGVDLVPTATLFSQQGSTVAGSFNVKSKRAATRRPTQATVQLVGSSGTREIQATTVAKIKARKAKAVRVDASFVGFAPGRYAVQYCVDTTAVIAERNESNNCATVGGVQVSDTATANDPMAVPAPLLCATANCSPIAPALGDVTSYSDATGTYWVHAPDDGSSSAWKVLIWLHGCGGFSSGDVWTPADGYKSNHHYLTITPDGADGGCWNPSGADSRTNMVRVLRTRESVIAHFNVDPKRIVVGGYSSGGDLAFPTVFFHSTLFAGVLSTNTAPFRDTGFTSARLLNAASRRFPVFHVGHTGDATYPRTTVDLELDDMVSRGHPVGRLWKAGTHWDNPDTTWTTWPPPASYCDTVDHNGNTASLFDGTSCDIQNYLVPHMGDADMKLP